MLSTANEYQISALTSQHDALEENLFPYAHNLKNYPDCTNKSRDELWHLVLKAIHNYR